VRPAVFRAFPFPFLCVLCLSVRVYSGWPPVPEADFSALRADDFNDSELEVPYFLFHFARVANAVEDEGEHRGFLRLRVNREPRDNEPYNARILEMQKVLAYFYTADRPWNPYRGHPAVRVRLEAMMDKWVRIQAPPDHPRAGLFTEYGPENWSMAPTAFGCMAMAKTVDLLRRSDQPVDPVLMERVRVALRRGVMALLTREDMQRHARQWSNQFSPVYSSAMVYLSHWPDAELRSALAVGIRRSVAEDKSPAGFYYEQGGPDFGYTSVHERNVRVALPLLRREADLLTELAASEAKWVHWLRAMYVPQQGPEGLPVFFTPAGLNTRTSHALQRMVERPLGARVPESMALAQSREEREAERTRRRTALREHFGRWGPLPVPSAYSYRPSFVYMAGEAGGDWFPSAKLRDAAVQAMPCFGLQPENRLFHDPLPLSAVTVRRPSYYAVLSAGRIRVPRQNYGLGLLWNRDFGIALQSVSGERGRAQWVWGTEAASDAAEGVYEQFHLEPAWRAGGRAVTPRDGVETLRPGDLSLRYGLEVGAHRRGEKRVEARREDLLVTVTHRGPFVERLPLLVANDARVSLEGRRLVLTRPGGAVFEVEVSSPTAEISTGRAESFGGGFQRIPVRIRAEDDLEYRLRFR